MRQWISLDLPAPPEECRPNARVHWRVKAAAAKEYRYACKVLALNERNAKSGFYPLPAPVSMSVTFLLKDKRTRDWDNLIAAFKPGLDGIVDAGIISDDSVWVIRHPSFAVCESDHEGITVTLEAGE